MSLTVPRAGLTAGRAPRAVMQETPQGGAAAAALGDVLSQVGGRIEAERLDRQYQRLQVDLTRDLNNLRLEYEQVGDPDRLDAEWPSRVEALKQSYLSGETENGRPRVDAAIADQFGVAFDDLANRHAYALGSRSIDLRNAQREATFMDFRQVALSTGAGMDADTRAELATKAFELIEADLDAGAIDAAEAQRRRAAYLSDSQEAYAIRLAGEYPEAFLTEVENGAFASMPVDQVERLRQSAQAGLAAAEETAAKEARAAIGAQLTRIRGIEDPARLTQADRQFLQSPEAQDHPEFAETQAHISLNEDARGWQVMAPADLDALIRIEEKRPVTEAYQEERLALLRKFRDERDTALAQDPLAHVAEIGYAPPELPEFDPADPASFAEAIARRRAFAQEMGENGWTFGGRIFSDDELARIKTTASVATDPSERLALARAMAGGIGTAEAERRATAIADDAAFGYAVGLLAKGTPPQVARSILEGQRRIADKTVVIPSEAKFVETFRNRYADAFKGSFGLEANLVAAARAIYANQQIDAPDTDIDTEAYKKALSLASGAIDTGEGGLAGGIQPIEPDFRPLRGGDEYFVALPAGVRGGDVEIALEALHGDLRADRYMVSDPKRTPGAAIEYRGGEITFDRFAQASRTGQVPDFGDPDSDDYDPQAAFEDYRIMALPNAEGQDIYIFAREVGGITEVLSDTDGRRFEFSLRRLLGASR